MPRLVSNLKPRQTYRINGVEMTFVRRTQVTFYTPVTIEMLDENGIPIAHKTINPQPQTGRARP